MANILNVPPVTGKTPAEVAKELRTRIRDLWTGLKSGGSPPSGAPTADHIAINRRKLDGYDVIQRQQLDALRAALLDLVETSKRRRPSETRKLVESIRGDLLTRIAENNHDMRGYAVWAYKNLALAPAPTNQHLLEVAERAYALVQALPTIDKPSTGKDATTIRALTAILKVHFGLDIEKTVENLPDMMGELLQQIAQDPQQEAVMEVFDDEGEDSYGLDELEDQGMEDESLPPLVDISPTIDVSSATAWPMTFTFNPTANTSGGG